MVYCVADNILSPLGMTTAENYLNLKRGDSSLAHYASYSGREGDDYVASRFSSEQRRQLGVNGLTWFESLLFQSAEAALSSCHVDVSSPRTILIISTTKANIELLSTAEYKHLQPAESARRVASLLGATTQPLGVCNACISGVAAIITAQRLLESGCYDNAIVVGCDVLSHFVVSGFQSLKALSPMPCRPFDIERIGLNLGEAAATLILSTQKEQQEQWRIVNGAIRNDAFHISSPSPKGEGCANAIRYATEGIDLDSLSAINVHGTATMYNDQMESKAIAASGLSDIPMNTLKGYYGHTMGAAGILETILTMHSVQEGELLATRGFSEIGVSGRVNISSTPFVINNQAFLKIISGFGGCNAAICCSKQSGSIHKPSLPVFSPEHCVSISPQGVVVDGRRFDTSAEPDKILTDIYKRYIGAYPKFYKMDRLSQLGFVASELLLEQESPRKAQCEDRAVVLFNHSSSIWVDHEYEQSISNSENYYPSPSLFVYTLPNIVCGEIALRNGYHAETSFYILPNKNEAIMHEVLCSTFLDYSLQSMVAGWIEYEDENNFEVELKLIKK